jgi:hypothetical protein
MEEKTLRGRLIELIVEESLYTTSSLQDELNKHLGFDTLVQNMDGQPDVMIISFVDEKHIPKVMSVNITNITKNP